MKLLTKASYSDELSQREMDSGAIAGHAAVEGIVLLKNDGTLPIGVGHIALYGAGACMTIKGGTGSGEVNERHSVTIEEAFDWRVTTQDWLRDYKKDYAEALAAYKIEKKKRVNILKPNSIMDMLFDNFHLPCGRPITMEDVEKSHTDTCIYVLSRQAGEGGDRRLEPGDYLLTDEERQAIAFCAEHYAKFILVINSGSAIDVSFLEEIEGINAVVYMCQLGMEGGNALVSVLSGTTAPSGKLSDTWPKRYEDIPFAMEYSHLNGNLQEEFYKEGIYVGYRYFDSFGVEPAFPFGFGLTYGDFSIHSAGVTLDGCKVTVKADVFHMGSKNSPYAGSECYGKEVVQLYVSPPEGELHKPYQSLVAFGKTMVMKPGWRDSLDLCFDLRSLASYREYDASFVLEKGEYILRLGNSSRDTVPVGVVYLERDVIVSRNQNICVPENAIQELQAPARAPEQIPAGLPYLVVDADAIPTLEFAYEQPKECQDPKVQEMMAKLSLKDMVDIVVGNGMFGGETRFNLPGSVGNTTSKFWDRGLANVALCDGPAGLRIQKRSTVDKRGKIKPVDMAMSIFESLPDFIKKLMVGDPEKETVLYQYTTAFPVANALAQTWNQELMEHVGDAIHREMKEYGCTFWLAPAVNIHRNPLCGRNFEYFSEDPVLAGKMAAAITRGVQQEEGFYVTVKHFACNNQEDNRNKVSSNISERTLREIYLRPFEITLRDGGAKGMMTSYNKINGRYAANSYDICTKVLRNEWGFDGVVMTDWFSTNHGLASSALCLKAGNDLIMPGGGSFKNEIMGGIKSGLIDENDIRICCSRVIKAILNSDIQKEFIG